MWMFLEQQEKQLDQNRKWQNVVQNCFHQETMHWLVSYNLQKDKVTVALRRAQSYVHLPACNYHWT